MTLRLLHPFTPFVTEEIWGHLRSAILESSSLHLTEDWPDALIIVEHGPNRAIPEGWEERNIAELSDNSGSGTIYPQSSRRREEC